MVYVSIVRFCVHIQEYIMKNTNRIFILFMAILCLYHSHFVMCHCCYLTLNLSVFVNLCIINAILYITDVLYIIVSLLYVNTIIYMLTMSTFL